MNEKAKNTKEFVSQLLQLFENDGTGNDAEEVNKVLSGNSYYYGDEERSDL